ncbi:RNA polymerase sigma factor [Cohnella abietis]|uniref:RNA polymerase sigma factor n=1 Tax=Cohnella abietis TaxID=2507935 RepID=A0A3T1DAQ4_9BACL|nr:RNA polymerase sigma factor [Cohnella abietis]BBI35187.1 RNA polymerase sigma factor [Cohnella abietis]
MTDEQLLEQLKLRNKAALEAVIYRYHAPIFSYITRLVRHPHIAEDLTQECFTRLCLAVRDGRLPNDLRPWMYTIATNLCKDLWKKVSYKKEVLTDDQTLSAEQDQHTVASILDRQWQREEVIRGLSLLSDENRQIVVLRYYQDLKLQEIAIIMELPLNTLKSKLYQALKKLAQLLEDKEAANDG